MIYKTEQTDNGTTRYTYYFENDISVNLLVDKNGLINIILKEHLDKDFLCEVFKDVTNKVIDKDLIPKINIKNSNCFLQSVAEECAYRKIPCKGISFSIWTFP